MPCKGKQRVDAPRNEAFDRMDDPAEKLFACGEQLKTMAMKLYHEGEAEKRRNTWGRKRMRLLGYLILVSVLQALAAEYLLKGLAARDKESYLKTHNLHCLYADLEPTVQDRLGSVVVSEIGTTLPEFLEAHHNDFVNWRYVVFEPGQAITHHLVFDNVLAALIDTSNR